MYAPHFRLKSFETIPEIAKLRVIEALLEALTASNCYYLVGNPQTPLLYESGVRYEEEPPGRDEWQDIPDTIVRRAGDCEDLAAWRMAELRVRFRDDVTRFRITVDDLPDQSGKLVTTYHITLLRPGKNIEDPSRRLGMP